MTRRKSSRILACYCVLFPSSPKNLAMSGKRVSIFDYDLYTRACRSLCELSKYKSCCYREIRETIQSLVLEMCFQLSNSIYTPTHGRFYVHVFLTVPSLAAPQTWTPFEVSHHICKRQTELAMLHTLSRPRGSPPAQRPWWKTWVLPPMAARRREASEEMCWRPRRWPHTCHTCQQES